MGNVGPELVVDWSPEIDSQAKYEAIVKELGENAVVVRSDYPEGSLLVEL